VISPADLPNTSTTTFRTRTALLTQIYFCAY
jgi:hypothetical protein